MKNAAIDARAAQFPSLSNEIIMGINEQLFAYHSPFWRWLVVVVFLCCCCVPAILRLRSKSFSKYQKPSSPSRFYLSSILNLSNKACMIQNHVKARAFRDKWQWQWQKLLLFSFFFTYSHRFG